MEDNINPDDDHVVPGYPIVVIQPPTDPVLNQESASQSPPPVQKHKFYHLLVVGTIVSVILIIILLIWMYIVASQSVSLPQFRLNNASVSNFNVSSIDLKSNWEFDLLVRNPNNKFKLNYEPINGSVFFRDKLITQKLLPPFSQNKNTNNNIIFSFSMDSSVYIDEAIAREIIWNRNDNFLSFDFRMSIGVRYKLGFWKDMSLVNVLCENIKFKFSSINSSDGIMFGGTHECQLKEDEVESDT